MTGYAKDAALDEKLSQQLYQALTAEREALASILLTASPEVVKTSLKNPRLDEGLLLAALKRRDLPEEALKAIGSLPMLEASHQLKLAVVHHHAIPSSLLLKLLPQLYLFELVNLCQATGLTTDHRFAAEQAIIQRIPTTPLGDKITLARRGTATVLAALLREGDSRIVSACLDNPRVKEGALYQFLAGPNATADSISAVARHSRWGSRPGLRLAILGNPRTPLIWFTLFTPQLSSDDLKNLYASRTLKREQKQVFAAELTRRETLQGDHTNGG